MSIIPDFMDVKLKHKLINCQNINSVIHKNTTTHALPSNALIPLQIQQIYGINNIVIPSNKLGLGITVAVIIAYHYQNLQRDLDSFCVKYGLAKTTLNVITMQGATYNSGWAMEECLDVQMIHTIAPYATIYVIEAKSASLDDMISAIQYANNLNINIISMSFGTSEFLTQSSYAKYFNNPNICYVASSGDNNNVEFPSSLQTVLCVGGTTIEYNNDNTIYTSAWSDAGCGISKFVSKPSYQSKIGKTNYRNCCDLSLVANPNSGVSVCYDNKFYEVGGTSISAPLMSGILAIANQLRKNNNKSVLTTSSNQNGNVLKYIYTTLYANSTLYKNNFVDVVIGTDGKYTSVIGYDYPTGIGTPKCDVLCNSLLNA